MNKCEKCGDMILDIYHNCGLPDKQYAQRDAAEMIQG